MNSQKVAGWIATAIAAVVVAYVLVIGQKGAGASKEAKPAAATPPIAPAQQAPATKGPVVRDLPLE